ncbi:MAG TPA: peptide-binding protein, partial [bacterium]|nr:peptide-binding protein [bacterium]
FSSCHKKETGGKTPDSGPAGGDAIVEASIGEPSLLNPLLASDSASGDVNNYVYNGLLKYNEYMELVPELAESWEVSKDGREILFRLKKDVRWHDGKPFTARDVLFTYSRLTDPDVKTPFSSDYLLIKDFIILDDHAFKLVYREPLAPALESWGIGIVPEHLYKNGEFNTQPLGRNPVGTGPYRLREWKSGEYLILEANPDYFEGKPYIERIIYRIIPDSSVQFLELRKGNLDLKGLTPEEWVYRQKHLKKYQKFKYPSFSYTYLAYNLKNPLFKEISVRKALARAVNKKEIIEAVLLGLGEPATGPFHPSSWAYNNEVEDYEYDPGKARALLEEAGWSDSDGDGILDRDGKKFSFTILTNQGNKMRELCAAIIQENLRNAGIEVRIRIIEWASFIHHFINPRKFEAVVLGWNTSLDPDQFPIWHSSQQGENQYNFAGYE